MNQVLHLKGRFEQAKSKSIPGAPKLPTGKSVEVSKLKELKNKLQELKEFWEEEDTIEEALISVYYTKVAAKSNRIKSLLSKGKETANTLVVGARFSKGNSPKHIITHYVPLYIIEESIEKLNKSIKLLDQEFNGKITAEKLSKLDPKVINFGNYGIAKTNFQQTIVDCFYVKTFDVLADNINLIKDSIVTIYKTDMATVDIMERIGINLNFSKIIDETTILLTPDQLEILKQKAPYLISMAVSDLTQLSKDDFTFDKNVDMSIPRPKNEPTIGVIDTMFDESVYFSEWVDFTNLLSKDIPLSPKDYEHGTAVSSIIVDGPSLNPHLDDGCGRFKVKHFGVASGSQFSSFTILRNINEIILQNRDIKVWNLCLGSRLEINSNFISPEAEILDKIQYENDVIFIIAGTNKDSNDEEEKFIGAPADSINSIVVNSVTHNKQPASYTRKGPVLSFFTKPDISYYGGDEEKFMKVYSHEGESLVRGTSYAAPWIARKMSYLIDILGMSREVAKALLIDSATGWDKQVISPFTIGHGVVPIKIEDIVNSADDEIQFILSGVSEEYDTYNYNLPIPVTKKGSLLKEEHPFVAKATLCYFPFCSRNQGVDYTNTEIDISFGRLSNNSKQPLKPINNNYQSDENGTYTWEEDARKIFRKWDNIKHIKETFTGKNRAKKAYDTGLWGLSLKTKERLNQKHGNGLKFGIVITLKEINGKNRIEDFIRNCSLRGWIVNKIDVENKIDIYNIAEEEIVFGE